MEMAVHTTQRADHEHFKIDMRTCPRGNGGSLYYIFLIYVVGGGFIRPGYFENII